MRIIEIKGSIAKDGSIVLPPGVLETMGVATGETVHLAYLSHHPVKQLNRYGEFFITKDGIDSVSEPVESPETAELSVPHALLEAGLKQVRLQKQGYRQQLERAQQQDAAHQLRRCGGFCPPGPQRRI